MAQATLIHFVPRPPEDISRWREVTEQVTAEVIYGLDIPEPGYVTIRTPLLDLNGSSSDADTELQIEIAGGDWPSGEDGKSLGAEEAVQYFEGIAEQIGSGVISLLGGSVNLNLWATPYLATGWKIFRDSELKTSGEV